MLLGRILVTIVTLITLVGSNLADWNHTHLFSELWSPHARFHGGWFIFTISLLSLLSLYLVWSQPAEQPRRAQLAALIQACIWIAFFSAMLVPGAALADPGKSLASIAGIEINLFGALAQLVLLAAGMALLRSRSPQRS